MLGLFVLRCMYSTCTVAVKMQIKSHIVVVNSKTSSIYWFDLALGQKTLRSHSRVPYYVGQLCSLIKSCLTSDPPPFAMVIDILEEELISSLAKTGCPVC